MVDSNSLHGLNEITIFTINIWEELQKQTVQTLIRLLFEQTDQGLHYLPPDSTKSMALIIIGVPQAILGLQVNYSICIITHRHALITPVV